LGQAGDLLLDFLERAGLDGHTVTQLGVAGAILTSRSLRLENALADLGPLVAVGDGWLGLRRLVDAERSIAEVVLARAAAGTLVVVAGPAGKQRDNLVAKLGGPRPAVLEDAEQLDVETFAAFLASCADHETVVLVGDLDELSSIGPGRVFADVVRSDVVAMRRVDAESESVLEQLLGRIVAGEFVAPDDPSRQVVVLDVASVTEAAHRVGQLLGTSIPRALAIPAADVQVICVTDDEAVALRNVTLDAGAALPVTIGAAVGLSYAGVVLVLGPSSSGLLTRQLVYSGSRRAVRHLSIVNATGRALFDAVRLVHALPRRTKLSELLATQLSSGSHSRSSSDSSSSESSRPSTGPNGVTSS
jgi:hypothetical protein